MEKLDFIFVVLVYRNTDDLRDFFENFKIKNSKVIVVNSYYDDASKELFQDIATENGADFLSVPNKGYGFGNNCGCKYALAHYQFDYLIISNADIEIRSLDKAVLDCTTITAPMTVTLHGKRQNPHVPYHFPIIDRMLYKAHIKGSRLGFMAVCAFNRMMRELWVRLLYPILHNPYVHSAHGAFVILPFEVLNTLYPLYNERQFLFCEEDHLAQKAKAHGIKIKYNPKVKILHKEDGSVSLIASKVMDISRKSFLEYYQYWYVKGTCQ